MWNHPEVILYILVIWKSSGSHQEVIRKSSWSHPEVILKSSWTCLELILKSAWRSEPEMRRMSALEHFVPDRQTDKHCDSLGSLSEPKIHNKRLYADNGDDHHASLQGSYLSALTHYLAMFSTEVVACWYCCCCCQAQVQVQVRWRSGEGQESQRN